MRFTLSTESLNKRAATQQRKTFENPVQKAETIFEPGNTYHIRLFLPPSDITEMLSLGKTWPCVPVQQAFIKMGEKQYSTWFSDQVMRGGIDTVLDWTKQNLGREQGYYDLEKPSARIERMRRVIAGENPEYTILSEKAITGLVNKRPKGMDIQEAEKRAKQVRLPSQLYKEKYFVPMVIVSEDLNEETGETEALSKLVIVEFKNSRFMKALGLFTHWVASEQRHVVEGSLFHSLTSESATPQLRKKSALPENAQFFLFSTMAEELRTDNLAYDIVVKTKSVTVGSRPVQDYDLSIRREGGAPKLTAIPEETIENVIGSQDEIREVIMRGFGKQTESGAWTRPLQGIEALKVVLGDITYAEYSAQFSQTATAHSELPETLPGEEEAEAKGNPEQEVDLIEKLYEDAIKVKVNIPEEVTSTQTELYTTLRGLVDMKLRKLGSSTPAAPVEQTLPFDAPM